jgi:Bifunctional DNA primase/polymerase, N-terminal
MSPQPQASPTPSEFEAALGYAQQGIPVFPTNPLDKKPLINGGFKNATTDETQIRDWWQRWPNAMIGTPTGPASGMWVTDVDQDPIKNIDGMATLTKLIAQYGELPKTLMTVTPRGGRHLIFAWDNGVEIRNSTGKVGQGIDVRGEGGYVCLPPSRRALPLGPHRREPSRSSTELVDRVGPIGKQIEEARHGLGARGARAGMRNRR